MNLRSMAEVPWYFPHLERIYTQLVIIWQKKQRFLAFLGGDFQKLNEFKNLKLTI